MQFNMNKYIETQLYSVSASYYGSIISSAKSFTHLKSCISSTYFSLEIHYFYLNQRYNCCCIGIINYGEDIEYRHYIYPQNISQDLAIQDIQSIDLVNNKGSYYIVNEYIFTINFYCIILVQDAVQQHDILFKMIDNKYNTVIYQTLSSLIELKSLLDNIYIKYFQDSYISGSHCKNHCNNISNYVTLRNKIEATFLLIHDI